MFNNVYKDKKVLVTGNTGFKGAWLTIWLLRLGAKVYGISKDIPTTPSLFEKLNLKDKITHYQEDIRDTGKMISLIADIKPDFVFHMAAQPIVSLSYRDPIDTISSNVMGTAAILEALRLSNHQCIAVIITSDKCYDNVEWVWGYKETDALGGKDIYSGSKGAAEVIYKSYFHSFLKNSNIRSATARAGNVIGGGDWAVDRIVPDAMKAWSKKEILQIRRPNATRPWQHVLEPLGGYLTLGAALTERADLNGESFNFGPKADQSYTVRHLIESLSASWYFEDKEKAYHIDELSDFHEAGLLKLNCDKALYHLNWSAKLDYNTLISFTGNWYYQLYNNTTDMYALTLKQIEQYESL